MKIGPLVSLLTLVTSTPLWCHTVNLTSDLTKVATVSSPGDAVVVVVIREGQMAGNNIVSWRLFDIATGKFLPSSKPNGGRSGFELSIRTNAQLSGSAEAQTVFFGIVPAGDYVLAGHIGNFTANSFCFGAPVAHVAAGTVSYIATFRPYNAETFRYHTQQDALEWQGDVAAARALLSGSPTLQTNLVAAPIHNGAQFDCSGDAMWSYHVPGAPDLPSSNAR